MADYILVVQLEVDQKHAKEFNDLYDNEHVPNLLSVKGVLSGTRYELERNAEDQLRYLAVYELARADIPESAEWQKAATTSGWMTVRPHVTARRRGVFRKMTKK
jgi:hypothetical protein